MYAVYLSTCVPYMCVLNVKLECKFTEFEFSEKRNLQMRLIFRRKRIDLYGIHVDTVDTW